MAKVSLRRGGIGTRFCFVFSIKTLCESEKFCRS